jgi:hypothetical protein
MFLFVSFSIDRSRVVRRRKCLVYTHTIRFINHAMVTTKSKQRRKRKIRSFFSLFSIQSKNIQLHTTSINQPVFLLLSLNRCTCCAHIEKKNLSCHQARIERERDRERKKKRKRLLDRRSIGTAANLNFICIKNLIIIIHETQQCY